MAQQTPEQKENFEKDCYKYISGTFGEECADDVMSNCLKEDSVLRAKDSYRYEKGRRKAINNGLISLLDLEIYFFLNDFVVRKANAYPEYNDFSKQDAVYDKCLSDAYYFASRSFEIEELRIKQIYDKVRRIPRC